MLVSKKGELLINIIMNDYYSAITPKIIAELLGDITVQGVYKALRKAEINISETKTGRKKLLPKDVRKFLELRGFKFPKLNISFQIVKGGVGKTSLSFLLATRASHYGAKVLIIDLDQQGNMTRSFHLKDRAFPVMLNIIRDKISMEESIIKLSDSLHLLPSNLNNSKLDIQLTQESINLRDVLTDLLRPIRDNYDIIIFDCPPAINKINLAATCCSNLIIIPVNPDPYAMDGLEFTLSELKQVKKDFKLNFDKKIVWNRYDARERLGAIYMHELVRSADKVQDILPVVIRTDASIKSAVFFESDVFNSTKKSSIQEDADQFCREILGLNKWKEDIIK